MLRRFNRTYTQRIGALDESFLGTGRPLGPSRLLFEVGSGRCASVRELRDRLGLDSGYLSRLLRTLESDGLVEVRSDPDDARRRRVTLTRRGRTAWRRLDDRSEELARNLVAPLSPRQRERLTDALATADLLVRAATVRLEETAPTDPRAVSAMAAYFAEIGERFGFEAGDAWQRGRRLDGRARRLLRRRDQRRRAGRLRRRADAPRRRGRDQADVGARRLARGRARCPPAPPPRGPEPGARSHGRPAGHQRHPHRGDRDVRARRLPRHRPLQRQPVGALLVREGPLGLRPRLLAGARPRPERHRCGRQERDDDGLALRDQRASPNVSPVRARRQHPLERVLDLGAGHEQQLVAGLDRLVRRRAGRPGRRGGS